MNTQSKYLLLGSFVAAAITTAVIQINPAHAQTRQVDCEVVYNGETKIKARCEFEAKNDYGVGSFRISKATDDGTVFGEVQVSAPGVGDALFGTINGDSEDVQGAGEVRRNGACWANSDIKICTRSLAPPPAAKGKAPAKKAPPKKAAPR